LVHAFRRQNLIANSAECVGRLPQKRCQRVTEAPSLMPSQINEQGSNDVSTGV